MSYTAKTAFEARVTNNRNNDLISVTGRYQASSNDADCDAGRLVVRNGQLPCAGFTNVKNENAWYMNDATSTTNAGAVVYAANTYEVPLISGQGGNLYAVGTQTLGLGIPAGRDGTFTKIVFDGDHARGSATRGNRKMNGTGLGGRTIGLGLGLLVAVSCPADALDELLPAPRQVERRAGSAGEFDLANVEVRRAAVPGAPEKTADEAYVLEVSPSNVCITAASRRGERWARVTLEQLLRLSGGARVPCCQIVDWPALKWRGYMNDCGRNFLELDGVKAIVDMMSRYKMNLFHWHLSDYHGWRLESKKYPQLQDRRAFIRL